MRLTRPGLYKTREYDYGLGGINRIGGLSHTIGDYGNKEYYS